MKKQTERLVPGASYARMKEYPNIPVRALKAAGYTVALMAAAHALPDVLNKTGVSDVPFFGGMFEGPAIAADWLVTQAGRAVTFGTEHIPHATDAPNLVLHNNVVQDGLRFAHAGSYVKYDDLVSTEAVVGAATGYSALQSLVKFFGPAEKVKAPTDPYVIDKAHSIADTLGKRVRFNPLHPVRAVRGGYKGINPLDVAVEIQGMADELREAKTDKTAVLAPLVAGVINSSLKAGDIAKPGSEKEARRYFADVTLTKEVYRRLPAGHLHRLALWLTDNTFSNIAERTEGAGDVLNVVSDLANQGIRNFIPKRDVWGNPHTAGKSVLTDASATVIGALPFIPFVTSEDVREGYEKVAKPALQDTTDSGMTRKINEAAAVIVGGKVQVRPWKFRRSPHKVS